MLGEEKLFINNSDEIDFKFKIKNNKMIIDFRTRSIDGFAIQKLLKMVNSLQTRFQNTKIPIVFKLGDLKFADKLTMAVFECICFYVIDHCKRKIYLQYNISQQSIWTECINSSPLLILGKEGPFQLNKYKEKFNGEIYLNHFRKVIRNDSSDVLALSKLMGDIDVFLRYFSVNAECRDKISEVVVELIGNAQEHTGSDCLVDIDVTTSYINNRTGEPVHGINIVILNYSDVLFGDKLKHKMSANDREDLKNTRYAEVVNAYKYHSKYFGDRYGENDFYNIASFQHRISGRESEIEVGGTGLTKLIESLEKMSDAHLCYMISGNRVVNFFHELLEYDENSWISFNKEGAFQNSLPEMRVIDGCPVWFPGTAFNLNFVMAKENDNG